MKIEKEDVNEKADLKDEYCNASKNSSLLEVNEFEDCNSTNYQELPVSNKIS